jgi:hypothetical protein
VFCTQFLNGVKLGMEYKNNVFVSNITYGNLKHFDLKSQNGINKIKRRTIGDQCIIDSFYAKVIDLQLKLWK